MTFRDKSNSRSHSPSREIASRKKTLNHLANRRPNQMPIVFIKLEGEPIRPRGGRGFPNKNNLLYFIIQNRSKQITEVGRRDEISHRKRMSLLKKGVSSIENIFEVRNGGRGNILVRGERPKRSCNDFNGIIILPSLYFGIEKT